jgi:hypothetical protein
MTLNVECLMRVPGIVKHGSVETPSMPHSNAGDAAYQNMLLFFFFSFSALVSLCDLSPQKLFFAFGCSRGAGKPLLKKLLWLAPGRCAYGACRYETCGCVGAGLGRGGCEGLCDGHCPWMMGVECRAWFWGRPGCKRFDWSPNCFFRRSVSLSMSACFRRRFSSSRSFCFFSCSRNCRVWRSSSCSRRLRAFMAASAWRLCSRPSASTSAFSRAVSASISHCARGSNLGGCDDCCGCCGRCCCGCCRG